MAQVSSQSHVISSGSRITTYGDAGEAIVSPYIDWMATWDSKWTSQVGFTTKKKGQQEANSVNLGLRRALSDSLSLSTGFTLSSSSWQPTISNSLAMSKLLSNGNMLNSSVSTFLSDNEPVFVFHTSYTKRLNQSSISAGLYNQLSKEQIIAPTLTGNFTHSFKSGDVLSVFAQMGSKKILDNNISSSPEALNQFGFGTWGLKTLGNDWSLQGNVGMDKFSKNAESLFQSTSFGIGIRKMVNTK